MKNRNLKSFIVNTVHDSAIIEVHPDEIEEVKELAVQAFSRSVYKYLQEIYGIEFNIPLGTEIKVGNHWNEADEGETKHTPECPFKFNEEIK